jgi:UDP-3-O-[3-hydroxymyristoyl] glucosamine N-acyltransferase
MPDPRFFHRSGPFTARELANLAGAELGEGCDPERVLEDVAPLADAGPADLSFLDNSKYADVFAGSKAGACLVRPHLVDRAPEGMVLLVTRNPHLGFARCAQAFYPRTPPAGGVSPGAHVHESAVLGQGVEVSPGAVVEAGARIGDRCRIGPNAVVGANAEIGEDTVIGACASVSHCLIGCRVTIYPGARVGQDGFGFAMDLAGHVRVPQLGRVIIEDDVEVGANVTIDRGAGPDTVIGKGVMIDNLVQIAHNVRIGPGSVIVAQAGIAGSTRLDHHVVLAAQAGVAGHLKIGAGARIAAQSGIMRDVEPGAELGGSPAVPQRQWLRQIALLDRMARGKKKRTPQ